MAEQEKTPKTGKRELACAMLAYYFVMLTVGIWYPGAAEAADSVKFEAFAFAVGAFALQSASTQFKR